MSLGTLVDALSEETDIIIADVFNYLPQKVYTFILLFFIHQRKNQIIPIQLHTKSIGFSGNLEIRR